MIKSDRYSESFSLYEELKSESGAFINSILSMNEFSEDELLEIRKAVVHQLIVVDGDNLEEIHQKTVDLREALMNVTARINFY